MELNIEYLPVDQLTPYEHNARKHQDNDVAAIVSSIRAFGFDDPIGVWGGHNVIVEGHGRLMAAKKLGMEKVPVIHLDHLTDEQRRAYALAHNRTAELSEWDEVVKDLELRSIDELDMSQFGFDLSALKDDGETVEDDYDIDAPVESRAKHGDIWQLGRHRLMCGDCTDVNAVDKLMDGHKADMVLTDPPYGINIVNENGKIGPDNHVKSKIYRKIISDDTTDTAQQAFHVLSQICESMIIWGGNYFTSFLPFSDGWVIWDKRVDMNGNNFADGEMAWCSFHTPVRIYHQLWSGMIREGEREQRVHPTQKPVRMLGEIIKDFSKADDTIIDVFGGSGSTLIACEQTGRTCYMMELDPHYVDVIIARWEDFTGQMAELLNGL